MSVPKETLWPIEPHTKAKHDILRRYLGAWFGIMGPLNPRIIYLDGFCGPGRYEGGEIGSPIIALKIALEHSLRPRFNEIDFLFIEEREDRVLHLDREIKSLEIPPNFRIESNKNQFEDTLTNILDGLEIKGERIAPTFAFVDPFGFKGASYQIIQRLLSNEKTEIFISFMADSINRFIAHPDPQIRQHIIDLFGTTEVLEFIESGDNRVKSLRLLYQKQLSRTANYVRYFEMCDERDRPIYYLFFASNNRLGHSKMKEAFWNVDSSSGYKFSDVTDPNQFVLFEMDPSLGLADELVDHYSGRTISVDEIKIYIEDKTAYIEKHMRRALLNLEEQGRICVEPCKQDGSKRRNKTFPDGVIVNFYNQR